jgi:biopolymer transport protein ExbD
MDFPRRRKIDAQIDMTPMIDTLLQLFLIFLISASFVASAVRLELPKASVNQKSPTEPLVVSLDADNQMFLNQEPIAAADLRGKLTELLPNAKNHEVLLRADQSLPYKHILHTIAAIKQAGVENIHLAYDEEKGK